MKVNSTHNCTMSFTDFDICHQVALLRMLCSTTLTFSRSNISCYVYPVKIVQWRWMSPADLQICLDSHGSCRGVDLVVNNLTISISVWLFLWYLKKSMIMYRFAELAMPRSNYHTCRSVHTLVRWSRDRCLHVASHPWPAGESCFERSLCRWRR